MKSFQRGSTRAQAVLSQDRLLDVNEAAALLGLQPSTLYQWAYQRRIPVVKLGRALRFRMSALLRLIEGSERPALSDSP